jgi:hypothetical protein
LAGRKIKVGEEVPMDSLNVRIPMAKRSYHYKRCVKMTEGSETNLGIWEIVFAWIWQFSGTTIGSITYVFK